MLDSEENSETSTNPEDELNFCEDLFTAVMTATDGDTNRPLHLVFQLLPSKKVSVYKYKGVQKVSLPIQYIL